MNGITGKFLIDTNVLIYATLEEDPRFEVAQAVLNFGQQDGCQAFLSVQSLAEMYPNLTGPKTQPPDSPAIAYQKILAIARLPHLQVLPITLSVVERALDLCRRHKVKRQRFFDMQLVSVMLLNSIPTMVTENDSDFQGVTEIQVINPFATP
ncbi:MAG: PIN domain-containing protein [Candidatus Omnitrophica bacterium]|nr:PIN domain-containing protein [Candidatus Omnitrophota bacterium]